MYGTPTDPQPYIQACYFLGFISIFGYSTWLVFARKKYERYLKTFNQDSTK